MWLRIQPELRGGGFTVNHNTFNDALRLNVKNLELRSFAEMLANNAVLRKEWQYALLILQKILFRNCIKVAHRF